MEQKETAIVPKQETSIEESNFIKGIAGEFQDAVQVRGELIKIPRIKLNNAMSDATQGGLGKIGDFTCQVRGVNFGPVLKFYPLLLSESASFLNKDTSEIICMSRDLIKNRDGKLCRNCPHGEYWNDWGTKSDPKTPACKASIDMIVALRNPETNDWTVMQLSFRKTSYPAGRAIVNLIAGDPRRIPFGRAYSIVGRLARNEKIKKDYWHFDANSIEKEITTLEDLREIYPIAKQMMEMKRAGKIDNDFSDDGDESVEAGEDKIPF
jgi:hypothetical protein